MLAWWVCSYMYIYQLCVIAEDCNFSNHLNQKMLLNRLVGYWYKWSADSIPLACYERFSHFWQCLQGSTIGLETVVKNYHTVEGLAGTDSVHKVQSKSKHYPMLIPSKGMECFWSEKGGHLVASCHFRTAKCHQCGCIGHVKADSSIDELRVNVKSVQESQISLSCFE